jgi:S1-C subfamily serine protease
MYRTRLKLPQQNLTGWVVNMLPILAAVVFTTHLLWQILVPNVNYIARQIAVRIDGASTGSGIIIDRQNVGAVAPLAQQYLVLTNWHVVKPQDDLPANARSFSIGTVDGRQHRVVTSKIVRVGNLDLAILEFQSRYNYAIATIGNSDRVREGEILYVAGWADPSPQISTRIYQFLVGNLSGRIDRPEDGYALVYTVNALPGMSGGPVLDRRGNLVGINGRATVDLRTGTVNSVLGIDINRYLRVSGNLPIQKWHKYN